MSALKLPGGQPGADEEDVDVDALVEGQAANALAYTHAPQYAAVTPPTVPQQPTKSGRTRPTNNQLLYKAYFRWGHYQFKLQPGLVLPDETEACASVTSAFLQVLNTLFFVETRRIENPRNILQLLSMNTRRTKVVELSSGTHRVPDELRRHSLSDGGTGSYSTNLDRNRYGNDDQYLSTVIRYDLEFLDLCPCMVDVEIIDAKNGQGSILVSADPEMCNCGSVAAGGMGGGLHGGHQGGGRHVQHTAHQAPMPRAAPQPPPDRPRSATKAASGTEAPQGLAGAPVALGATGAAAPGGGGPTASKGNSGSELFDALLIAATGGTEDNAAGATSKQAAPANIPRARSRLWHTGASAGEVDSLQNAVDAFKAGDEEIASGQAAWEGGRGSPVPLPAPGSKGKRIPRRSSLSNMALLSSPDDGAALPPVAPSSTGRPQGLGAGCPGEESGENGPARQAEASAAHTAGHEEGAWQSAGQQGVARAGSAANLARLGGRDQELRRLQDDFRGLKEDARALEGQLAGARAREHAATSAAHQARAEADVQRQTVAALRAEVARLISAKESAEAAAASVRSAVQAQGGTVSDSLPSEAVSPSHNSGVKAETATAGAPPPQSNGVPAADAQPEELRLPPIKRPLEGAAEEEASAKRPAVEPAVVAPAAPESLAAPAII